MARALACVDAALADKVSAKGLANSVHISLSQLERLLGEQLGLPVRRLVLWRRLRLAIALVLEGQTLTSAAHRAGFSDSVHFSRTVRSTFGVRADRSWCHVAVRLLDLVGAAGSGRNADGPGGGGVVRGASSGR